MRSHESIVFTDIQHIHLFTFWSYYVPLCFCHACLSRSSPALSGKPGGADKEPADKPRNKANGAAADQAAQQSEGKATRRRSAKRPNKETRMSQINSDMIEMLS